MSDERARRVGLNEALFRQVNEQINALNRTFGEITTMTMICECGDGDCTEQLEIPLAEYEGVRADSRSYIVVPGHVIPDLESVVDRKERYEVVRKGPGVPSRVAEETDPRS